MQSNVTLMVNYSNQEKNEICWCGANTRFIAGINTACDSRPPTSSTNVNPIGKSLEVTEDVCKLLVWLSNE